MSRAGGLGDDDLSLRAETSVSSAAMTTSRWDDATLDAFRMRGDALADEAVAALFKESKEDVAAIQRVMNTLVFNDQAVPEDLPAALRDYFGAFDALEVPAREEARVRAGERFFATHGPEICLVLGCFSLPAAYAARKGVQVLYRTGYLAKRPNRRLFETTQMLIDVMTPGGLERAPTEGQGASRRRARGLRTIQKVRLMHAAVRNLIQHDASLPWDAAELGVPINQEDLAGTLMTFSEVVLEGLRSLHIEYDPEGAAAYLDAWRLVGALMGVDPRLIPADLAEAEVLTKQIHDRQIAPSAEGKLMTRALLDFMEENVPLHALDGLPASLMRLFFEPYPGVADELGIPAHRLEERLLRVATELGGRIASTIDAEAHRYRLLRAASIAWIQLWINVDRGGQRAQFEVPTDLREYWDLPNVEEPSVWERLGRWVLGRDHGGDR